MLVQFPSLRLAEFRDARAFNSDVAPWLVLREAENCYMLGDIPRLIWSSEHGSGPQPRFFALKDREQIVSAAVLHPEGGLLLTWASPEMVKAMAEQMAQANCVVRSVLAPAHAAGSFCRAWAGVTGARWEYGREERIYQLIRVRHTPGPTGRLMPATAADGPLVTRWLEGFARDADYEQASPLPEICKSLIDEGRLFLWHDPQPVAMAAWVTPTPHGGSINFVYAPPEARGKGHGKNVVAALAKHVLAAGSRYCFILTDTQDRRNNHLYQSIGARTVAELLQCPITPVETAAPKGRLSIVTSGQARPR